MRGVYGGLAVHSFDVLTDILVIIQWIQLAKKANNCHKNVDPQIMAYSGIAVLVVSKALSTIAIFIKERNIRRAVLQLFDLLIFEEIFESHNKIIHQMRNKKSIEVKDGAIESTLSFKYIRNFEAVFESIPQSVLQLVFIMRIESVDDNYGMGVIFVISIIQSVISMTNSILNNDYTQMQDDKWKKYKQRLPPTFEFFKHAICRLSEVIYRIGLFSLFWTVCGGLPFAIMLSVDLLMIICLLIISLTNYPELRTADSILLSLNSFIVIPSEEVYSLSDTWSSWFETEVNDFLKSCCLFLAVNIFCCYALAAGMTSCLQRLLYREEDALEEPVETQNDIQGVTVKVDQEAPKYRKHVDDIYAIPTVRVGISLIEMIFLIMYGIFGKNGENKIFLLSPDHGLYIFIATCVSYLIYCQYKILFPDFSLPLGVNARSKWGYAYLNELNELQKLKVRKVGEQSPETNPVQQFWDEAYTYLTEQAEDDDQRAIDHTGMKQVHVPITAAVFALANGNMEIVSWLEEQGAIDHKGMDSNRARKLLETEKS